MKPSHPEWLERTLRSWMFYWSNLRTSIDLFLLSLLVIGVGLYLNSPGNAEKAGDYFFSIGSNLLLISLFSIFYEARTRETFRTMLAEVNPNIESGVTVHSSHQKAIARDAAIATYLGNKEVVRIRTSTADNYVRTGEPANLALLEKINAAACKLRILLYLPVFQEGPVVAGQRGESPSAIVQNQIALLDSYRNIIAIAPRKVTIKFFFSPLHVNFMMLGDNRMFSSLIPNKSGPGVGTPCFEIFPTGSTSLFFQFQKEFDTVFLSEDPLMSMDFNLVEPLLRDFHGDLSALKTGVLAIANAGANPSLQGTLRDKAAQRP